MSGLVPHLRTRRVALAPAGAESGRVVYDYLTQFGMTQMSDPDTFSRYVRSQSVAMFTVELHRTGEVVGFAMLQKQSPARHVEVGIYTDPGATPAGAGAEATVLLINYAFAALDVLKVWSVTTELSREGFGIAFATGTREATLPGHFYFQGRLWDAYHYSVSVEEWRQGGVQFLDRLVGVRR